jgi:hypothetical protein
MTIEQIADALILGLIAASLPVAMVTLYIIF